MSGRLFLPGLGSPPTRPTLSDVVVVVAVVVAIVCSMVVLVVDDVSDTAVVISNDWSICRRMTVAQLSKSAAKHDILVKYPRFHTYPTDGRTCRILSYPVVYSRGWTDISQTAMRSARSLLID